MPTVKETTPASGIRPGRKPGFSKETYIAALAILCIAAHLIARYGLHASSQSYNAPLLLALLVGGAPLLLHLLQRMLRGEFGSDLLAGLSIMASAVIGEYLARMHMRSMGLPSSVIRERTGFDS